MARGMVSDVRISRQPVRPRPDGGGSLLRKQAAMTASDVCVWAQAEAGSRFNVFSFGCRSSQASGRPVPRHPWFPPDSHRAHIQWCFPTSPELREASGGETRAVVLCLLCG